MVRSLQSLYLKQRKLFTNNKLIKLLYPPRCPLCGEVSAKDRAHRECVKKLKPVGVTICFKCGKPVEPEEEYCPDCRRTAHEFEAGRAVWVYDEIMEESIVSYKYKYKKEYGVFYAEEACKKWFRWLKAIRPDVIIPVPVSNKKKRSRGFNQAEVFAAELSRLTGIPMDSHYLIRNKNTLPQKELTPAMRLLNLMKAFDVSTKKRYYPVVLLVDDIYTTGSTMEACTRILKRAGVGRVFFLTICIGAGQQ